MPSLLWYKSIALSRSWTLRKISSIPTNPMSYLLQCRAVISLRSRLISSHELRLGRHGLRPFLFCSLQPVRHAHLAVHRRRGGEVLLRLLALARAPVELAEAEVAVGDERAHAELGGEGQGGAVVCFGRCYVDTVTMRSNLAKKAERPGLRAAVTAFTGQRECVPR